MRKRNHWVWLKVGLMLLALVGVFSAISKIRDGAVFRDPNSPVQVLLEEPAAVPARRAKMAPAVPPPTPTEASQNH